MSVDRLVGVTGAAYGYAGDDPVNGSDPLGLSWWGVVAGIVSAVAGAVSVVAIVASAPVVAVGAGIVAAGLGIYSTINDSQSCFNGNNAACVGFSLGALGTGASVIGLLPAVGVAAAGIGAFADLVGLGGTITEIVSSFAPSGGNPEQLGNQYGGWPGLGNWWPCG